MLHNFRLIEYEACESLAREIMEQLTLRDREPRTSQAFAALSARIRIRLKQYNNQVRELRKKVNEACRQHTMYPLQMFSNYSLHIVYFHIYIFQNNHFKIMIGII